MNVARVRVAVAVVCLGACTLPDVGPPLRAACSSTDTDPAHTVSFVSEVVPIFKDHHCAACHTRSGKTPIGIEVSGLDLSSYDALRSGGIRSGADIVVEGKPCDSILLQKLSEGPPFGSRMPLDGPPYLDDKELEVISNWIVQGAHGD